MTETNWNGVGRKRSLGSIYLRSGNAIVYTLQVREHSDGLPFRIVLYHVNISHRFAG